MSSLRLLAFTVIVLSIVLRRLRRLSENLYMSSRYPRIIPRLFSTGNGSHVTRMLEELMLKAVKFWGGALGAEKQVTLREREEEEKEEEEEEEEEEQQQQQQQK